MITKIFHIDLVRCVVWKDTPLRLESYGVIYSITSSTFRLKGMDFSVPWSIFKRIKMPKMSPVFTLFLMSFNAHFLFGGILKNPFLVVAYFIIGTYIPNSTFLASVFSAFVFFFFTDLRIIWVEFTWRAQSHILWFKWSDERSDSWVEELNQISPKWGAKQHSCPDRWSL